MPLKIKEIKLKDKPKFKGNFAILNGYTKKDKQNLIAIVQNEKYGYTFIKKPNNDMDKVNLKTLDAVMKKKWARALTIQKQGYKDPVKKYRGYPKAPNNLFITGKLINSLETKYIEGKK